MEARIIQVDEAAATVEIWDNKEHILELYVRYRQGQIDLSVFVDSPKVNWVTPKNKEENDA